MAVWQAKDINDLRADLADTNNRWDADALNQLMDRASRKLPAGNAQMWVDIACAMALMQLLPSAARFNDWVVAEEQQKKSDIWKQLNGTYQDKIAMAHVRAALNIEGGAASAVQMGTLGYQRSRGNGDEFSPLG